MGTSEAVDEGRTARPRLGADSSRVQEAHQAVAQLVGELQQGWDEHDADITNRHFAQDVLWGGPFGASVSGYDRLHAIHVRMKAGAGLGPTRYEIEQVLVPAPGVAVAHVRRVPLSDVGEPLDPGTAFSEMAMYVLVKRDDTWWLAAGQNTPVVPGASADGS